MQRPDHGQYEKLREDRSGFHNFLRIDPEMFQALLDCVGPRIQFEDTLMRKALEPGHQLALTLRYLVTGDSDMSLQYVFHVAHNTISHTISSTYEAIIAALLEEVLKCPAMPQDWKLVSDKFAQR